MDHVSLGPRELSRTRATPGASGFASASERRMRNAVPKPLLLIRCFVSTAKPIGASVITDSSSRLSECGGYTTLVHNGCRFTVLEKRQINGIVTLNNRIDTVGLRLPE